PNTLAARAVTIVTSMRELRAFPERIRLNRPRVASMAVNESVEFDEDWATDLDVIIIGGGQAGLMLAARLRQVGVRAIIVEKSESIGDVWRARYPELKLHNEISVNHFPYLPYPESWPAFLPRDKVVSWLEFYAKSMELDIATNTTFVSGSFDQE